MIRAARAEKGGHQKRRAPRGRRLPVFGSLTIERIIAPYDWAG
jgi:hypothetical protein